MTLELLALICFAIGTGVYLLVGQPSIKEVARIVGGVGGVLYGLILLFTHL